jgi:alpha-1,2-mannosyltransferase
MPIRWPAVSQRAFVVGLLGLFVAVSVQYSLKVLDTRNGVRSRSAIQRWREQLLQLDSGENIYARFTYPNPPIMALMLRPIADLPPLAGALTWFYLKVVMALVAFAAIFRVIETEGFPFPPWAKALVVLMSLRPVVGDLSHGNVNLFILFLVAVMLYAFRRGWDLAAGIILALAIACKVTPALFAVYFLWKRAWLLLAGCAIGLVLFFGLIPAMFLGWDQNAELLSSWVRQMVTPFLVGGVVTSDHPNQSLPGLVTRMLTASPSFSTYVNDVYTPVEYHNVLALQPGTAKCVVRGCMVLFAGLVMWTCRAPMRNRGGWRLAAEAGIIALGMLLFSERTWKHHCVILVVPFAVLTYLLAVNAGDNRMRRFLIATLVAVQVMMATTSTALWPDEWAKLAQVYGAYVAVFALLVVGHAVALRRVSDALARPNASVVPASVSSRALQRQLPAA